jgi:aminomethyltransferase
MNELGVDGSLEYMSAGWQQFENDKILICRTGYTGELGFELIVPNSVAHQIWMKVIEAGVTPIGLGARDTLRLEMGYPLHGNDISEEINPFEAGLKWAVAMSKQTFLGKEALESLNLQRKRIALQMIDRGIPRGHMRVYHDGNLIGEITSGGFSPTLKVGIALALVDISFTGTELDIDIRSKLTRAQVVKLPLVKGSAR